MKSTIWKTLIPINRCALLLKTCCDERSDFPTGIQATLTYQDEICMEKRCAFNEPNELKTSNEKRSEKSNRCETADTSR